MLWLVIAALVQTPPVVSVDFSFSHYLDANLS